jgi:hypothetical protein
MFNKVNLTDKTVYLNSASIAFIENHEGKAFIRLQDGSEHLTNEDYEEFLALFEIELTDEDVIDGIVERAKHRKHIYDSIVKDHPGLKDFINYDK